VRFRDDAMKLSGFGGQRQGESLMLRFPGPRIWEAYPGLNLIGRVSLPDATRRRSDVTTRSVVVGLAALASIGTASPVDVRSAPVAGSREGIAAA
jgi:hypothetical protein